MDPEFITNEHWADISTVLRFLWLYWLFIIGFATNMLLAHALIPISSSGGEAEIGVSGLDSHAAPFLDCET